MIKGILVEICALLAIFCFLASSCEKTNPSVSQNRISNPIEVKSSIAEIPTPDNEVDVTIKAFKSKRAVLVVRNLSQDSLYLPFLPAKDGDWSSLGCEGLEKFLGETEGYSPIDCSIAGLGYHPLDAGKSLKYLIWVIDTGKYRVNFVYFKDVRFVDEINRFNTLFAYL